MLSHELGIMHNQNTGKQSAYHFVYINFELLGTCKYSNTLQTQVLSLEEAKKALKLTFPSAELSADLFIHAYLDSCHVIFQAEVQHQIRGGVTSRRNVDRTKEKTKTMEHGFPVGYRVRQKSASEQSERGLGGRIKLFIYVYLFISEWKFAFLFDKT